MLNLEEREEGEGERKVASDNELNFRLLAIRKTLPINEEKQGKGDVVRKCGCGRKKMFALLFALFYYTPISNPRVQQNASKSTWYYLAFLHLRDGIKKEDACVKTIRWNTLMELSNPDNSCSYYWLARRNGRTFGQEVFMGCYASMYASK
nr:hypothetical protein CFP56_06960 [Quercus suber]